MKFYSAQGACDLCCLSLSVAHNGSWPWCHHDAAKNIEFIRVLLCLPTAQKGYWLQYHHHALSLTELIRVQKHEPNRALARNLGSTLM